ncbi:MAG: Cys-tRNA(Pro) deacylase [Anaerovoracaceae bacterium]
MAKKKETKTNAMRLLEQHNAKYEMVSYMDSDAVSGVHVAAELGEDPEDVFKTLVTVGKTRENYVFVIPVAEELDLKKAAKSVGEKKIEMIKSKELLPLTGYIHGGCSPIGMKKQFQTVIDQSAINREKIFVSGGKIGLQVHLTLNELKKIVEIQVADLIKK